MINNNHFVDVKGFIGFYKISPAGSVLSVKRNKIIKPWINTFGYLNIRLNKNGIRKTTFVHG